MMRTIAARSVRAAIVFMRPPYRGPSTAHTRHGGRAQSTRPLGIGPASPWAPGPVAVHARIFTPATAGGSDASGRPHPPAVSTGGGNGTISAKHGPPKVHRMRDWFEPREHRIHRKVFKEAAGFAAGVTAPIDDV
jgi:hypothetical protein